MSDDELREFWRDCGGKFYGPNVEHGTMPEAILLPLLREILETDEQTKRLAEKYGLGDA